MDHALATGLLANGHPITVWNRSSAKADDPVANGATLAGSIKSAVEASPLVIVCVTARRAGGSTEMRPQATPKRQ